MGPRVLSTFAKKRRMFIPAGKYESDKLAELDWEDGIDHDCTTSVS